MSDNQKEEIVNKATSLIIQQEKELASLREQLEVYKQGEQAKTIVKLKERLQQKEDENRELKNTLESVLRLKTILTYEENIPPEHEGEAIAISNLFCKIENTLGLRK